MFCLTAVIIEHFCCIALVGVLHVQIEYGYSEL